MDHGSLPLGIEQNSCKSTKRYLWQ